MSLPVESVAEDLLTSVSKDKLTHCARLLALSVAHHRAKFGAVPIATSSAEFHREKPIPLLPEALNTLEEALALVRQNVAEKIETEPPPKPKGPTVRCEEKRRQIRISVTEPVNVSDLYRKRICASTLKNISWGGAAVRCEDIPVEVGERLCLLLPAGSGDIIKIVATVLRESIIDGEHEYGLRFDSLVPEDEDRLLNVLKLLMSEPDQDSRRSEARLVQRLEVEYGDAGEFQAVLEDISPSDLMLTVPSPLEIDQSLLMSLSSADTSFGLNLRAGVIHQTLVEESGIEPYRVGLKFEHPSPHLRERVTAVINELATMRMRELPAAAFEHGE